MQNQYLYIPPYNFDVENIDFNLETDKPCFIEYCSGNGDWIIKKAEENPDQFFFAVEKRADRVKKIRRKTEKRNLKNLFLIHGCARPFTKHFLKKESIEGIYINFPDPWPKKRHAKHRLIQKEFVRDMSDLLKWGKELLLVTDDSTYRDQMIETLFEVPALEPKFEKPYFVTEWQDYGSSFFHDLFIEKGQNIYFICFIKKKTL